MKANTIILIRRGYLSGIGSGLTWGLDAVLLGMAMLMTPFLENPILLMGGALFCSMLHDVFAAIWLLITMIVRNEFIIGALFGGPLAMTFYLLAIAKGGSALAATVTACYPLLGSVLAIFILKEKVQLRGWIGLLICVIGIIWIGYSPESHMESNVSQGILFSLIAAIGWATEAVICGYGMKGEEVNPQIALLLREITSGIVYIFIVAPLMLGGYETVFRGIMAIFLYPSCWILILVTALIGMSSFFLWYTSIDLIGAAKALCFNVTYSFWAVIFSFILIGSQFTWNVTIGSLLIIGGVSIATLTHKKK